MANDLTREERALLEEFDKTPRRRKATQANPAAPAEAAAAVAERGPITPVQYDDDGWGDLPVQMRG